MKSIDVARYIGMLPGVKNAVDALSARLAHEELHSRIASRRNRGPIMIEGLPRETLVQLRHDHSDPLDHIHIDY